LSQQTSNNTVNPFDVLQKSPVVKEFEEQENRNIRISNIINRLNEQKQRKLGPNFTQETIDKIDNIIKLVSTNTLADKDLQFLENTMQSLDQWDSQFSRNINYRNRVLGEIYGNNTSMYNFNVK
jgi:hypothetical protein